MCQADQFVSHLSRPRSRTRSLSHLLCSCIFASFLIGFSAFAHSDVSLSEAHHATLICASVWCGVIRLFPPTCTFQSFFNRFEIFQNRTSLRSQTHPMALHRLSAVTSERKGNFCCFQIVRAIRDVLVQLPTHVSFSCLLNLNMRLTMFVSHPIEYCRACWLQDHLSHPNTRRTVGIIHHTAALDPSGEHLCFSRSQRLCTTLCEFFCMRSSKLSCDASANNFIVAQTRATRWTYVCSDRCSARHQVAHHSTSST